MNYREIEESAAVAMQNDDYKTAIKFLSRIVRNIPNWEHGLAFYNLAICYEELGETKNAEESFLNALKIEPNNNNYLDGYASFLFEHGNPKKAFDQYLRILEVEELSGDETAKKETVRGLYELGKKLKLSGEDVNKVISDKLSSS